MLAQPDQVPEVNCAVLIVQGLSYLHQKGWWQVQMVVITEPIGQNYPKKVDYQVVEAILVVLQELEQLIVTVWVISLIVSAIYCRISSSFLVWLASLGF